MSEEPKKKLYLTITFRVWDYWFDWDAKLVHVLMTIGSKLVLVEREIK